MDFAVLGSIRILKNVLFGREKVVRGSRLIAGGTRLLRGLKPLRLPRAVKLPPRAQIYGPIWVSALQNRAPSPPRAQCPRGGQEYFATKKFVKIPLPGRGIPREGNPSPPISFCPAPAGVVDNLGESVGGTCTPCRRVNSLAPAWLLFHQLEAYHLSVP